MDGYPADLLDGQPMIYTCTATDYDSPYYLTTKFNHDDNQDDFGQKLGVNRLGQYYKQV